MHQAMHVHLWCSSGLSCNFLIWAMGVSSRACSRRAEHSICGIGSGCAERWQGPGPAVACCAAGPGLAVACCAADLSCTRSVQIVSNLVFQLMVHNWAYLHKRRQTAC